MWTKSLIFHLFIIIFHQSNTTGLSIEDLYFNECPTKQEVDNDCGPIFFKVNQTFIDFVDDPTNTSQSQAFESACDDAMECAGGRECLSITGFKQSILFLKCWIYQLFLKPEYRCLYKNWSSSLEVECLKWSIRGIHNKPSDENCKGVEKRTECFKNQLRLNCGEAAVSDYEKVYLPLIRKAVACPNNFP